MQCRFELICLDQIEIILPILQELDGSIPEEILRGRLKEMVSQGYRCVGIYDEDILIGICGLWILTKYYVGKHIEPDNVFVRPEYQNKGIGKLLMEWVYDYAKKEGCIASELNCYVSNKNGQQFWENEGYDVLGYHYQKKL